jgi:hypothetical protein
MISGVSMGAVARTVEEEVVCGVENALRGALREGA